MIYIYAFSRRFYPKRLALHSSYSFTFFQFLLFPGNRTHDLGVASAMLYHLSYRKAYVIILYIFFLFVLKPWLTFVREHGNSERILDVGGGEIITDIKTRR